MAYPDFEITRSLPRPKPERRGRSRVVFPVPVPPDRVIAGAESLIIESASIEVPQLGAVGTVAGVVLLKVAARNGPGIARLRSMAAGTVCWRGPGSDAFGPEVIARASPGAFSDEVLVDGEDTDKWARVRIWPAYLQPPAEAVVYVVDLFNNAVASDDVASAEATAGDVETHTVTLANHAAEPIYDLRAWLDSGTTGLAIGTDGAIWYSPTTEQAAVQFGSLAAGATTTLHIRRTISAGAEADPGVLNLLHFSHCGV